MQTQVESVSQGVAVVIPPALASRAGLTQGTTVNLEWSNGRLVIDPPASPKLASLIARITAENLHGEWMTGQPVGAEQL